MSDGSYKDAATTYGLLRRIDCVENAVCTRLVAGAAWNIDNDLRALKDCSFEKAMRGDHEKATIVIETKLRPAAQAFFDARGAGATTELVDAACTFVKQRQQESVTLKQALEALNQANEERSKLDAVVQILTEQKKAMELRLKGLDEQKRADEAALRATEESTRRAFEAGKQRIKEQISTLPIQRDSSVAERKERAALEEQHKSLEDGLRKRLQELEVQAESDRMSQEARIKASCEQQEQLAKQLSEAELRLRMQEDAAAKKAEDERFAQERAKATVEKAAAERLWSTVCPRPEDRERLQQDYGINSLETLLLVSLRANARPPPSDVDVPASQVAVLKGDLLTFINSHLVGTEFVFSTLYKSDPPHIKGDKPNEWVWASRTIAWSAICPRPEDRERLQQDHGINSLETLLLAARRANARPPSDVDVPASQIAVLKGDLITFKTIRLGNPAFEFRTLYTSDPPHIKGVKPNE